MNNLLFMLYDITCGNGDIIIDSVVPKFVSIIVNIIKFLVPVVIIIFGIIDLFKASTANDEKVMKEAQKKLISRIIYAVLVFFVVAIVQFVFKALDKAGDESDATSCISCFINGDCTQAGTNENASGTSNGSQGKN